MSWTDGELKRLDDLWQKGLSGSAIARLLGNGHSRSAVIARAHQRKLPRRKQTGYKRPEAAARPVMVKPVTQLRRPAQPLLEVQAPLRINGKLITLLELTDSMCRRPFGDPQMKDFHYCGHERRRGADGKINSPYCPAHSDGEAGCFRKPLAWEKSWR